ncbi:MAG: SDR family NAD(P)-dependent oxidoreductase [Dehalococcoidia bacterium]
MTDRPLDGKVAIVTGSSRGIGEAIATSLAGAGAAVLVAARTEQETDPRLPGTIHSVAAAIRGAGGSALPVVLNLRDAESIQACVDVAQREFGRLDIVVNNAAVMPPGNIETVQDRHLDLMWQVDLRGPILMCKAAIPLMKAGGGGHIINVSSNLASMPGPGPYEDADRSKGGIFYSTMKAGLDRFTQGLAQDLAQYRIAANVLSLAYGIETPGWAFADQDPNNPRTEFGDASWMGRAATWIAMQPADYTGHIVFDHQIRYWLKDLP